MTRRFGLNGRDPVSEFGDGAGEVRFAELINALALVGVGMMPEPREADDVDAVGAWPAVALVGSYELLMVIIRGVQVSADAVGADVAPVRDPLEEKSGAGVRR